MSKKMLKRSLALGALMAFVITGSAMAAEPIELKGESVDKYGAYAFNNGENTGLSANVIGEGNETVKFIGNDAEDSASGSNVAIGGWSLGVDQDGNLKNQSSIVGVKDVVVSKSWLNAFNAQVDTKLTINVEGSIRTDEDANVSYFAHGCAGEIEMVANSMTVGSGSILAQPGSGGKDGIVKINVANDFVTNSDIFAFNISTGNENAKGNIIISAKNVTVDNENGVYAYNWGSGPVGQLNINIEATEKIVIEASDWSAVSAYNYEDAAAADKNITLSAKNIYLTSKSGDGAVYADNGSKITVGGNKGFVSAFVDGDVWSQNNSEVYLNLGEAGSFKGYVGTDNTSTTTLNVGANSTWNLTGASTVTSVAFGEGSVLEINGADFVYDATEGAVNTYALNGVGTEDVLKVDGKANIKVEGIDYKKYNVATGFEDVEATETYWNVSNLNTLMQGNWIGNAKDGLQLEVVAKAAEQMATEMGVSSSTAQSLNEVTSAAQNAGVKGDANGTGSAKAVAFVEAMSGVDSKVAGQAFEAVSKMAEAGGNSATAASIVKNVTGVTNDRLSFNCGHSAPHKGGHGVGLFEEGSGADVWVEYVHGKDEVEDMPSTAGATSYEGQYNGIVMGVDFKKVNKFQSGVAFNYGEGDTNSVGSAARTRSDYDFWGIGYYGSIHNDDSNVIFDIGYAKTDSDVENTSGVGVNFKASPETTTWTAGVKLEKLYQNENVQIVPYTGLRFMSIDPDDYSTECASASYKMERQNVWLLPLGVSIRQEIANDNGWTVSPKVDLSYIWAFGDTDSEMEFSTLGTKTNIGYEVMDDGSFLGLVGIEAHKGQWGFGVSYSYQKGDYSTSKKWFIDANYSF